MEVLSHVYIMITLDLSYYGCSERVQNTFAKRKSLSYVLPPFCKL